MAELIFHEKLGRRQHVYTLNGEIIESVTTVKGIINKPFLVPWAAKKAVESVISSIQATLEGDMVVVPKQAILDAKDAHKRYTEEAQEWGKKIHSEIEAYIKHCIEGNNGIPVELSKWTGASEPTVLFILWAIEEEVRFLASELKIYSERYFYAGTVDFIFERGNKVFVGDIKTSSTIYDDYYVQTAAYTKALLERKIMDKIHGMVIVNLPREDGGIKIGESTKITKYFKTFKACLDLHNSLSN